MSTIPSTAYSSLFTVRIENAKLPPDLADALGPSWVESSVNLPGAFHVTFRKSARLLVKRYPTLLRVGAKVAISAVADGQGKDNPLITGLVTGIEAEYQDGLSATVLRGLDHSFKMLRHRRATGYYNKTADAIVKDLAKLDGVEVADIQPTSPRYEVITQPNISDWQFIQYLADVSDMAADFDDKGRLRFRKVRPAVSGTAAGTSRNPRLLEVNKNMRHCRTGITASDQVSMVRSRGWDQDEGRKLVRSSTARTSPDFAIGTTPAEVVSAFGPATLTETGTPYGTGALANRAADSLAADVTSAFAELEVQIDGQPDLVPGLVVELKNAGPPFDGTYTVTATRHELDRMNNYTTWVWVTGRQVRTLYGLASGGDQSAPRIHGVVNAIVTDIQDPKQQGRVRLTFPWFSDSYTTDWVRTVQFGGHGGGGVISPEVDDEVLVAFDRGVMDYPYVIGGLYSGEENKPSDHDVDLYQAGGPLNRRSLVSRSGQRLELLDAEGDVGVRLRSGDKKLTVFLEESRTQITISSDGTVNISGKERLTLEAPYVNISGEFVNIKGTTTIDGALTLIGDAEMNGAVDINGAVVLDGAVNVNGFLGVTLGAAVAGDMTLNGAQVAVVP